MVLEWYKPVEPSAEFPGVREMLMHRAYQEALPYGGTWRLPAEGEDPVCAGYIPCQRGGFSPL